MDSNKIGFVEAICLLLIVTTTCILLNLPKIIISSTGSSSALNIIYSSIIVFLFVILICKLFKKFVGQDILDVSQYLWGNWFQKFVGFIFIIFLILLASNMIRNLAENLKIIYFQNTPVTYITITLLLSVIFINRFDFRTVVKCNLIIIPIILVILLAIFGLNTKSFVIERIFPIFGYGIKETFLYGAGNIFLFGNIVYLYFIMPFLKNAKSFNKIAYTSTFLCSLFLFLSVLSLLLIYPLQLSSNSSMPVYLETRELTLGKFIQRADALFILIWILTVLSDLSIALAFILNIFKKITNIESKKPMVYCFATLIFSVSLVFPTLITMKNFESIQRKYITIFLLFFASILILIFANIKKSRENKLKQKGDF